MNSELRTNLFDPIHINIRIYSVVKLSSVKLSLLRKQYWFKKKKNQYFPCVYEETSIKTRM